MGPDGFSGFDVQAVDRFLTTSLFTIVAHGVEFTVGHGNGGETNPDLGFPCGLFNFVLPIGFCGNTISERAEPIGPVNREGG